MSMGDRLPAEADKKREEGRVGSDKVSAANHAPAKQDTKKTRSIVNFDKARIAISDWIRPTRPNRGTLKASQAAERASRTADNLIEVINSHNKKHASLRGGKPTVLNGPTHTELQEDIELLLAQEYTIVPD